jgi:hypothetical protein
MREIEKEIPYSVNREIIWLEKKGAVKIHNLHEKHEMTKLQFGVYPDNYTLMSNLLSAYHRWKYGVEQAAKQRAELNPELIN